MNSVKEILLIIDESNKWFYVIGSRVYGPVSAAFLRERIKEGIIRKYTPVWTKSLADWTLFLQILPPGDEISVSSLGSHDMFSPVSSMQESPPDWQPERLVYFVPVSVRRYLLRCLCSMGMYAAFWRMACLRWYLTVEELCESNSWRSTDSLLLAVNTLAAKQGAPAINMKTCRRLFYLAFVLSIPLALIRIPLSLCLPPIIAQAVSLLPAVRAVERLNEGSVLVKLQARRLSWGDGFLLVPIISVLLIAIMLIAR